MGKNSRGLRSHDTKNQVCLLFVWFLTQKSSVYLFPGPGILSQTQFCFLADSKSAGYKKTKTSSTTKDFIGFVDRKTSSSIRTRVSLPQEPYIISKRKSSILLSTTKARRNVLCIFGVTKAQKLDSSALTQRLFQQVSGKQFLERTVHLLCNN